VLPEAGVGHDLAVEAGDRSRDRDDGGPRRELLRDLVELVALLVELGVVDAADQVASGLDAFSSASGRRPAQLRETLAQLEAAAPDRQSRPGSNRASSSSSTAASSCSTAL